MYDIVSDLLYVTRNVLSYRAVFQHHNDVNMEEGYVTKIAYRRVNFW